MNYSHTGSNEALGTMNRSDLIALTEDAAKVSGIQYVMEALREEALEILDS